MCGGVYYQHNGQDIRVYFPNPKATLPVLTKKKEIELLPWGRRKEQKGHLPLGGWARLDSIYAGRWDKWFPVPVKLPIQQFMEKRPYHDSLNPGRNSFWPCCGRACGALVTPT